MSEGPGLQFDCARCGELLLDFAYGELDELTGAAFKRHADGCARCTASLSDVRDVRQVFGQVALEEPGDELDTRILAAARTHAPQHEPFWTRLLESIRAAAMRPQLAMAIVLLLVVGVVLYLAPAMRKSESLAPVLAPEVVGSGIDPSEQAPLPVAPSAAEARAEEQSSARDTQIAAQAEEGPTKATTRSRALQGRARAHANEAVRPAQPPTSRGGEDSADADTRFSMTEAEEPQQPRRQVVLAQPFSPPPPQRAQPAPAAPAQVSRELDFGVLGAVRSESARGSASYAPTAPRQSVGSLRPSAPAARPDDVDDEGQRFAQAPAERQAPQAPASSSLQSGHLAGLAQDGPAQTNPAQGFDRGMANFQRGRYREAIQDLEEAVRRPTVSGDSLAAAHLTIARSYRQTGSCREATRRYEELMRRFTRYSQDADVTWEAAECYRLLGNVARADQLYRVAERNSRYTERARATRLQMEGARRAAPRVLLEAADEAAAEEPAAASPASH